MRPTCLPLVILTSLALAAPLLFMGAGVAVAAPDTATPVSATHVTVLLDDVPLSFPVQPFLDGDITMVPLRALSEALSFKVGFSSEKDPITCVKGQTVISLTLKDTSASVNGAKSVLPKAPRLEGDTAVVPLRFFSETLGYRVDWDPATYTAIVRSPKSAMEIWGFYALFGEKYPYPLTPSPSAPASKMSGAILGWFTLDADGAVKSSWDPSGYFRPDGWGSVLMAARANGCKPYAMFFADNLDGELSNLLGDPVKRERLALNVATASGNYDGIALDFEGLGADPAGKEKDAQDFTAFVESLERYSLGRTMLAILPPLNGVSLGYDHKRLGELADAVILMACGYEDPSAASATAPWDKVDEAIVSQELQEPALMLSRPAAKDIVVPEGVKAEYSPEDSSVLASWQAGGSTYQAFLEDNRSLQAHLSLAKRYGLRGAAIWRLGLLSPGWWDAVLEVAEPRR